jgi:hypothetical protein
LLSAFCLRFYENPFCKLFDIYKIKFDQFRFHSAKKKIYIKKRLFTVDPGIYDIRDPRWIGAWWIGFVILGTGILIFTIPMFLFPRHFKPTAAHKTKPYMNEEEKTVAPLNTSENF